MKCSRSVSEWGRSRFFAVYLRVGDIYLYHLLCPKQGLLSVLFCRVRAQDVFMAGTHLWVSRREGARHFLCLRESYLTPRTGVYCLVGRQSYPTFQHSSISNLLCCLVGLCSHPHNDDHWPYQCGATRWRLHDRCQDLCVCSDYLTIGSFLMRLADPFP
jgi:hypothetical protein